MNYSFTTKFNGSFEDAIERTTSALAKEKFGVLTQINLQETFKKKLGKDIEKYVILGACNPPSAYEAIENEIEIGLLLPCNVIIYEKKSEIFVSAIKPSSMIKGLQLQNIEPVMLRVEESFQRVIESL